MIGLAIYNSVILDFHFPLVLYKKLIKNQADGLYQATLEDVKDLDPVNLIYLFFFASADVRPPAAAAVCGCLRVFASARLNLLPALFVYSAQFNLI